MKTIKRYANRKLYDTESSAYVTLDEIAQMVKDGLEFTIIDNRTKRDITALTLAQILCEEEKKQSHVMSLHTLRSLIRTGEDFFQRKVRAPLFEMRDRTQETMERFIGRGADAEQENEPKKEAGAGSPDLKPALRELFDSFQHTLDESLHAVDEQVRRVLDGMTHLPQVQQDLAALRRQIGNLEARVMELEAELSRRLPGEGSGGTEGQS